MQPFWQSPCGRVVLWQGSCLEVAIPKEAFAVMDPPYNIGKPQRIQAFRDRDTGEVQEHIGQDFGEDFDQTALLPSRWVSHMPDAVVSFYSAKKMGRFLAAFHRAGYEVVQDFHWCKRNSPPPLRGVGFAWSTESGYLFRRKGTKHLVNKQAGYSPNFFLTSLSHATDEQQHTTQKPLQVVKWLIRFLTLPDSLVVDPFCGSGTTGVACAELGRRFMGIEQKADYCAIAKERIQKALYRQRHSFGLQF